MHVVKATTLERGYVPGQQTRGTDAGNTETKGPVRMGTCSRSPRAGREQATTSVQGADLSAPGRGLLYQGKLLRKGDQRCEPPRREQSSTPGCETSLNINVSPSTMPVSFPPTLLFMI